MSGGRIENRDLLGVGLGYMIGCVAAVIPHTHGVILTFAVALAIGTTLAAAAWITSAVGRRIAQKRAARLLLELLLDSRERQERPQ